MSKKRIFTEEEINKMILMYNEGETYEHIGKELKTKGSKVSSILKSLGYNKRKHNELKSHDYLSNSRKYNVDEDYFNIIDNQHKAYWLGFLFADGYVCIRKDSNGNEHGGYIELSLKSDDKYHIQNLLDDIHSNAKIKEKEINLNGNTYIAYRVQINSTRMARDLISHGCIQNKSLILDKPIGVPKELIRHFIRGYFDGDGCAHININNNSYLYNILGTENFLNFIINEVGLEKTTIHSFEHKKCFSINIQSKEKMELFHNYIYKDKEIYLERKYQKSLAIMKYRHLNDERSETQKIADLLSDEYLFDDKLIEYFEMCDISETAAMADLLD